MLSRWIPGLQRIIASCAAARETGLANAELPRAPHRSAGPDTVLRVDPDLLAPTLVAGRSGAGDGGRRARPGRDRADPQAVPPRPAGPRAIRLLAQVRPVGRSRRVAPHQGLD